MKDLTRLDGRERGYGFDVMRHISAARLTWGGTLGVLFLPLFAVAGATHLYLAFSPAGNLLSLTVSGLLAYAMMVGTAAHGSFPYIGSALKAKSRVAALTPEAPVREVTEELYAADLTHFSPLAKVIFMAMTVAAVVFSPTVAFHATLYPRWMSLVNPFVFTAAFALSPSFLPPILSRYLRPACVHAAFAPFFFLSVLLLWDMHPV